MTKLLLLSFFIGYGSRIQSHVGIGTGCSALRQGAWVDDEDTFDDLTKGKMLEVQGGVFKGVLTFTKGGSILGVMRISGRTFHQSPSFK